jgi:DNA adenine methylase
MKPLAFNQSPRDDASMQMLMFGEGRRVEVAPFTAGLLKWVGNKQRMAHDIVSYFPGDFGTYFEPFLGSGAVLATLQPKRAMGSDTSAPLVEIWQTLHSDPTKLKKWYSDRYHRMTLGDRVVEYERVKASYNKNPNGADLLFLCRTCYAGVVRFRQADGYMSTPCGQHKPVPPESFAQRVDKWHVRTHGAKFVRLDYRDAFAQAREGDLVYCDPPYTHSQGILYGAQRFRLVELLRVIADAKLRGVCVALSIDGTKRSGNHVCDLPIPDGLFEKEVLVNCGRSMLRRLQMGGQTLEGEVVADRLLLTY